MNCKLCKDVSVQTSICPLDLSAATIRDPSAIRSEPAVFSAVGWYVFRSS